MAEQQASEKAKGSKSADKESEAVVVTIKTLVGKQYTLKASPSDSIKHLKEQWLDELYKDATAEQVRKPVGKVNFVVRGLSLQDDKQVQFYNEQLKSAECVVFALFRFRDVYDPGVARIDAPIQM